MEKSKNYFAGANTQGRFVSLFGEINDTNRVGFLYILKGGPGTGKSTLMKAVGRAFPAEDVEYFYCSSDVKSLDGVRLRSINVAVVDGTAPHVCEASMVGVREKIINLGEFIKPEIKHFESQIDYYAQKKRQYFDAAYLYLAAASNLFEAERMATPIKDSKSLAKKIFKDISCNNSLATLKKRPAKPRRLFLSAVDGAGIYDLAPQNRYSNIYPLPYDVHQSNDVLEELCPLLARRTEIICFMELLSPSKINGIYIPALDTLITQRDNHSPAISNVLRLAACKIAKARAMHKKIESFYVPLMDFDAINNTTKQLIDEIRAKKDLL